MTVYNTSFEDDLGNRHHFYCGRKSVLGLIHPDYFFINQNNYKYANVATIKYTDENSTIYICETFDLLELSTDINKPTLSNNNTIHLEGLVINGEVNIESLILNVVRNNESSNLGIIKNPIEVILTEDTYIDDNGSTKKCLKLWCGIADITTVCINRKLSLANNCMPVDASHIDNYYQVEYLTNDTVVVDSNIVNTKDIIDTKKIIESIDIDKRLLDRVEELEHNQKIGLPVFDFCTIKYDNSYSPIAALADTTIKPSSIRVISSLDAPVQKSPDGTYLMVKKDGTYLLQLSPSINISSGESDCSLSVYVNNDKLTETETELHLSPTSNNYKFSTGFVVMKLKTTDKIYLKARWSNITDLSVVNDCAISISTLLQD